MFDTLFKSMKFADMTEQRRIHILYDTYMSDIPANFYLNQFELQTKYTGSTYTEWVKVLSHPAFKSFIGNQVAMIVEAATNKALGDGTATDKSSLNLLTLRKEVVDTESKIIKPVIIVMPESLFFTDEGEKK